MHVGRSPTREDTSAATTVGVVRSVSLAASVLMEIFVAPHRDGKVD